MVMYSIHGIILVVILLSCFAFLSVDFITKHFFPNLLYDYIKGEDEREKLVLDSVTPSRYGFA